MMVSPFVHLSLFAAELEEPKIGIWGKGLNLFTKPAFHQSVSIKSKGKLHFIA